MRSRSSRFASIDATKRLPRHQFHRDVQNGRTHRRAIPFRRALADVVDGNEVWVIERRCRARLQDEALQAIGIARDILPQDLEREVPAQDGVLREVHLAHPATCDQAGNVEAPDRRVRQIFVGHLDRVILPANGRKLCHASRTLPNARYHCRHDQDASLHSRSLSQRVSHSPFPPEPRKDLTRKRPAASASPSPCSMKLCRPLIQPFRPRSR